MRISDWSSDVCSSDLDFRHLQPCDQALFLAATFIISCRLKLCIFRRIFLGELAATLVLVDRALLGHWGFPLLLRIWVHARDAAREERGGHGHDPSLQVTLVRRLRLTCNGRSGGTD